jgi:hypothetical protein
MPIKTPPDWLGAMRRETAAKYCDMTPAQFFREVDSNGMLQPFKLGGKEMWTRVAIDKRLPELAGDSVLDWRAHRSCMLIDIGLMSKTRF